jgi:dipeptidyl aminopeptidase/acylaminoacyl peptidase
MADGVHDQLSPTARWLAHPFPVHADVASDGGLVAVTTTCIPPGAAEAQQQIVLLDVAGGHPRPLPAALPGDHTATWSPDGQRVAFITMRSGAAQVAVCAADATEPAVVISVPGPATGPVSWSPDGSRVAFTAGRGRTVDRTLPWRTTREMFWFDAVGHLDDAPQVRVADTGSGEVTMVTDDEWWWSAPRWSPDGERIAAIVGFDPDERRIGQQLRILEPDATVSTPAVPAGLTVVAVWAPDGSLMVLTSKPDGPLLDGDEQLHRVFPDGTVRRVEAPMQIGGSVYGDSPALIGEVLESAIAISGTDLFVRTHRGGRMGVARHSLTDGTWDEMVAGARAVSPLAMTGRGLVVAEQSAAMPCRISVIETGSDPATWGTPLSLIGEHEVPPVAEVHRFTVPSPHQGDLLEGWHLRPVDVEGPLPTVLLIHGGPGAAFGEMLNIDAQALCAAGFGVVYTNPHGSTGYGESFAAANIGNWGDLPTADVFAVIDEAIARGWVDPDRLGVAGLSYGGYLTCWLACTTDRFRAAVAENPVTNLVSMFGTSDVGRFFLARSLGADLLDDMGPYVRQSPLFHAARCHTPLLFVVGDRDHRCPPTQSFELHSVLRSLGRTSELLMLPDSFHAGSMLGAPAVRLAQDEALVEWMQRWLLDVEGEPERS